MLKLFVFTCLLALAWTAEIYYSPSAYYAPTIGGATLLRSTAVAAAPAVVPLAYARLHTPSTKAFETYNSVQTPDSFQQVYRSDYKPLTYEYVY